MTSPFEDLLSRLIEQAQRLAQTRAEELAAAPAQRWRRAALLWPLFTKG